MILRIAFRNVLRQRRRTALTVVAIVASFALLIVLTGISDGAHEQIAEIGVRMGLGDVVVYAPGYRADPTLDETLKDSDAVVAAANGLGIPLDGVAPRLRTDGLTQAGSSGVGTAVWGVDPAVEGHLSKVGAPDSIVSGAALDASDATPPPGRPPPIVIGKEMARELGAQIGDRVTVTIQPARGAAAQAPAMRTGAFLVKGIYASGVRDVDAHVVLVPLAVLQELAGVGHGVSMVAVLLRDTRRTPEAASLLAERLASTGVQVLPWQKAAPELYATIVLDEAGMYLMMIVVYVVVAFGILNTILISVLERTREFGVLLAVGATPLHVVRIVMTEAALLGVGSVVIGLLFGLAGNYYLTTHGVSLDVGTMEASGVLLPSHFYADLASDKVLVSGLLVFGLVVASALYPAIRAARLQPVEAMHHV